MPLRDIWIMEPRSAVLTSLVLMVACAAGAILISESRQNVQGQVHAEEFQHLVGGLGFGSALDLSGGAFTFDPRLDDSWPQLNSPFPSSSYVGSDRAFSIFYYPVQQVDTADHRGVNGDAPAP
jgi:hypothetical protein